MFFILKNFLFKASGSQPFVPHAPFLSSA